MTNEIPQKQMDQILAHVITNHADNIRELLIRNGYANAADLPKSDLQISFLKAIKDSSTFRNDVAQLLTGIVQDQSASGPLNFKGDFGAARKKPAGSARKANASGSDSRKPAGSTKLNEVGEEGAGWSVDSTGVKTTIPGATTTGGSSSSTGGFWSSLGSLASPQNLTSLFNTGLSAVSTKLTSNAQKSSEQNALELERIRLQQIQAQTALAANGGGPAKGLSTGAIVGIAAGGLLVVTLIIVLAVRKK